MSVSSIDITRKLLKQCVGRFTHCARSCCTPVSTSFSSLPFLPSQGQHCMIQTDWDETPFYAK